MVRSFPSWDGSSDAIRPEPCKTRGLSDSRSEPLILLFAAILFASIAMSVASLMAVNSLGEGLRIATRSTGEKILLAGEFRSSTSEMISLERGIVARAAINDRQTVLKYEAGYQRIVRAAHRSLGVMRLLLDDGDGRAMLDRADSTLKTWNGLHQRFLALIWANTDAPALAAFVVTEVLPVTNQADQLAVAFLAKQKSLLAESAAAADAGIALNRSVAIGLSILSLLVGAIGLVVVRRAIGSLHGITTELASGAEQVAAASRQISETSQSQATGASQQAASLEETSSASEQVSATSRENAASARQAAEATTQVRHSLHDVTKTMDEAVAAMGRINHSSSRISAILKVIDEIAFQTNILALNASVEAARAGEAGLGFAVVADEVRNLAHRCAQAAKDTSGLVDDSIASAGQGKERLDVLAVSVRSMTTAADSVQTLAAAVMEGSVQQAKGMDQISRTVSEIQRITQTNSAGAEEGASAGEQLSAQAAQLKNVVEALSVMIGA